MTDPSAESGNPQDPSSEGALENRLVLDSQLQLLERQGTLLDRLTRVATQVAEDGDEAHQTKMLRKHLDEFFLLVVVGEVKSGKSAFINALMGETVCAEGPTPMTDRIWILKHGDDRMERVLDEFVIEKTLPLDILRSLNVVDTPGTNSIVSQHQKITERFVPRADLILFVTSIDRPYSESEHKFLSFISQKWRKKVVFLITKIDTRTEEDLQTVIKFVRENCLKHHGFDPTIFPIAAKGNPPSGTGELGKAVGLDQIQNFIRERLSDGEKALLKFTSSANAAESIIDSLRNELDERHGILSRDFEMVRDVESQVRQTGKELKDRYHRYITRIYDCLRDFERRGLNFFDDILRLKNFSLLRDRDRFRETFEKEAVGDLKGKIDDIMSEAVDWLIREELALYETTLDYLVQRLTLDQYKDRIVGRPERGFHYNRDQVFSGVRDGFNTQIDRFDVPGECHRVLDAANKGILQQFGIQASALGVGTILVTLLTATWLDVTGIAFSFGLFLTGFAFLPRVRRQAQKRFRERVQKLIDQFRENLSEQFDREIDSRQSEIEKCYEPYMTFYRAETGSIDEHRASLKEIQLEIATLRTTLQEGVQSKV